MSSRSQETIYLKDYKKPDFSIGKVDLTFDIFDDHTLVTNRMTLRQQAKQEAGQKPLVLNGSELELISLKMDGRELDKNSYRVSDRDLTIPQTPEEFELEIVTKIDPEKNKSYEGLYFSNKTLVTQNEAQGFRKITYFLDRPDAMTVFTTTITADKRRFPVLLSNGNLVHSEDLAQGRHLCRWEDPFKKPCYLYALVAGDLGLVQDRFTTMSGREVDLRIYCEKGSEKRCLHAMDALKLSMKWDEEQFGREYDLDIYMIVAVDNFNAGAMENKGLNIFNSVYVLADQETATDLDYANITGVIGHEYFHNWSGNRVTLRDWFQLSLKEGLTVFRDQEFSSDVSSRAVKRIDDVNILRNRQFAEDAGPTAHPVRPSSVISVDNFFTVTIYEKGAELIGMIRTILGEDGFRKGMDLYFERHDGQAVTIDDFARAMEDSSGMDLTQFKLWYDQAGTPRVKASYRYDQAKKKFTLELEQTCPPTPNQPNKKAFHIPVRMALLDRQGRNLPLLQSGLKATGETETVLHLKGTKQTFAFENVETQPVPSLLRGFSAPVILDAGYSLDDLAFLMARETDSFCQWEAAQKLILQTGLDAIKNFGEGAAIAVPDVVTNAFSEVLRNEKLDAAFKARLLMLPDESYFAQFLDLLPVEAVHQVRESYLRAMAAKNEEVLFGIYEKNKALRYENSPEAAGRRLLKNTALFLLTKTGSSRWHELALQQLREADNMTDEIEALVTLTKIDCAQRPQAIRHFYEKWSHESLVMNKLLRAIATSPLPETLDNVKKYMQDPIFNPDNPNKVYSLIMGFGTLNPLQFHQKTGDGYRFLADQVLEFDRKNPHVAAYLASSFNHWKKLDEPRKAMMREQLERMKAQPGLSGNTFEIVSKNLGA